MSSEAICQSLTSLSMDEECAEGLQITLECPECYTKFSDKVKIATGDPRNVALIGHWDGWQPFSTSSKHGSGKVSNNVMIADVTRACMHAHYYAHIGTIEVSIATMLKGDHSKSEEVYVCGFVSSYLLPKKRPKSLDPFFHPLVEEVEELFINGNSFCTSIHMCVS